MIGKSESKKCDFEVKNSDGIMTVILDGEIDHHSAVRVRSNIDAKIYELRPRALVLDLSRVNFMDSSGLGLIMGRYALIQKLSGEFSISEPSERVLRVFELSGLGRIIKIEKSNKKEEGENI